MSEAKDQKASKQKGGRRGGKQFPQINLDDAMRYTKKLVSKTHNGPQPANVILPGVFDSATSAGKIRASAMKQYGLMQGEAASYEATKLAKDLDAAPTSEKTQYLRTAFGNVAVFKTLLDTFRGDKVSIAKLRQQAAQLDIHPDNLDLFTQLFVDSAVSAGLAKQEGDDITLSASDAVPEQHNDELKPANDEIPKLADPPATDEIDESAKDGFDGRPAKAIINVNVTIDSSLDTEKLEKQLKLLRRYGAI